MDLEPVHLALVKQILNEFAPGIEARVFGSRITHTAKKHSDLDLALVGEGEIDQRIMARLRMAFEESDLPFRVDLADWKTISPEFRQVIGNKYQKL